MFFKRRSRQNSYIEETPRSQSYDDYEKRPESSRKDQPLASPTDEQEMFSRPQQPQDAFPRGHNAMPNGGGGGGGGHNAMPTMGGPPPMQSLKPEPMPDLLTQAFNQAVRPYTEKIEQLESQLADLQAWVEQLEQQRAEVHGWIDKRGLRPGMCKTNSFF